jgi:ferritin
MAEASNIFIFILTILVSILGFFSKYFFDKAQDHEKRIQKMEDLHGDRLTTLEKKIDKLEISIQNLATNLHKEKNEEHNLTIAIKKLYEFLETHEKHN